MGDLLSGKSIGAKTLDDVFLPHVKRGDCIELSCDVPSFMNVEYPVLSLYSVHSVVKVFLDDDLIYSYGEEAYENGDLLGYGYQFVKLPTDYVGKNINYLRCGDVHNDRLLDVL